MYTIKVLLGFVKQEIQIKESKYNLWWGGENAFVKTVH